MQIERRIKSYNLWVGDARQRPSEFPLNSDVGSFPHSSVCCRKGRGMAAALNSSMPSPTILAVDDDRMVLNLLDEVLRSAGYHVLTADGGWRAIETYNSLGAPIQLLLTDVIMPDLTGPV